jgi:hypothetical protein
MTRAAELLDRFPGGLGPLDRGKLADCIDACLDCAQACTACAAGCLSEAPEKLSELVSCIRTEQDCADVCATTARVLSRRGGDNLELTRALLQTCVTACRACAEECINCGTLDAGCQVCAEVCRRCEQACANFLASLA